MKKFLLVSMVFCLLFGFAGATLAQEATSTAGAIQPDWLRTAPVPTLYTLKNSVAKLEKISHPKEINLFEKIKKIGTALWGVRKKTAPEKKLVLVKPSAAQCVKEAIDKKDAALKTAISARLQNILAAIDLRATCQKDAIDKTSATEQITANNLCISAYQKAVKDNNGALEKSRNSSWNTYRSDLKTCSALQRVTTSTEIVASSSDEIIINDGEDIAGQIK